MVWNLQYSPWTQLVRGIYNIPRLQLHNPPIPNSTNCSFSSVSMSGKKINLLSHQETFAVEDSLHIKYKELSSQGLIWDGFNNEHVCVKKKWMQKFTLSLLNRNPQQLLNSNAFTWRIFTHQRSYFCVFIPVCDCRFGWLFHSWALLKLFKFDFTESFTQCH